jgi:hypothetical protein
MRSILNLFRKTAVTPSTQYGIDAATGQGRFTFAGIDAATGVTYWR